MGFISVEKILLEEARMLIKHINEQPFECLKMQQENSPRLFREISADLDQLKKQS